MMGKLRLLHTFEVAIMGFPTLAAEETKRASRNKAILGNILAVKLSIIALCGVIGRIACRMVGVRVVIKQKLLTTAERKTAEEVLHSD